MIIEWLGHACFLIVAENGTKIICDPYEPNERLRYRPVTIEPDVVTVSHHHSDHGYIDGFENHFEVLSQPGVKTIKGITFKGVQAYHDAEEGVSRGPNVLFVMNVDHVRVCHLGDLGHELSPDELEKLGPVDVLLIPVGGFYTINPEEATRVMERINPKITIPMHFKTTVLDFPIGPVDDFLAGKTNVIQLDRSEMELSPERLPEERQIIVMKPKLG